MEPQDVKTAVDTVMTAFEEFKAANDKRLAEIEKKGSADILLSEKVGKIETTLANFEGLNQRLTAAELKAKQAADEVDQIEVKLGRLAGTRQDNPLEYKRRVNAWGRAVVHAHTIGVVNLGEDERKSLQAVQDEYRALAVSPDTAGGYLAPTEYVREIIKGVTEATPFRAAVRVRQTTQKAIHLPRRTGQFAARRTSEQGPRPETGGLAYGMEEVAVPEMYALIDISQQMLEDGAFDMEAEIRMEANEQFSVKEGAEFVAGTGVGELEGILTPSGVAGVVSGAATELTGDGVLSLFYGIKTAYARNAVWMMSRPTIGAVRKLKDSHGQYLWMPGLAAGVPNTINGAAYVEAPDMPAVAAGSNARDAALETKIDEASGAIADWCGRTLAQEAVSEVFRLSGPLDVLALARRPVVAIASVTCDGTVLPADRYEHHPESGRLWRLCSGARAMWTGAKVVVAYTGGYALPEGAPPALSRACIVLATSWWQARGRDATVRSESTGSSPHFTLPTASVTLPLSVADASIRLGSENLLDVTAFTLNYDLGAGPAEVIANRYTPDVFTNLANVTGSITTLRRNLDQVSNFLNETQLALHVLMAENETSPADFLALCLTNLTLGGANKSALGADGPRTQELPIMVGIDEAGGAFDATMLKLVRSNT
ncbi:phage major capsid protein [Falsiroseomonas selenitidurans]|uniref:phage major capsid protein n=1 Tax=Falsiroseomonas selenitidurans TaxID=2716335 RepID=UPI001ADDFC43|nr:phage major capsid protein [Falsiroseomonas selenitidurans]